MPTDNPKTTLQLSDQARAAIESRSEQYKGQYRLSSGAETMILRYAALLEIGRRELASAIGAIGLPAERMFSCACDALNGTFTEPHTLAYTGESVAECIQEDGLGEKWELPERAASVFEDDLSPLALAALADMVERYWLGVTRGDGATPAEFWQAETQK